MYEPSDPHSKGKWRKPATKTRPTRMSREEDCSFDCVLVLGYYIIIFYILYIIYYFIRLVLFFNNIIKYALIIYLFIILVYYLCTKSKYREEKGREHTKKAMFQ